LNDRCRREYASRRGRLAVPIDRLATTSLQRLRSRTGPLVRAGWRHL